MHVVVHVWAPDGPLLIFRSVIDNEIDYGFYADVDCGRAAERWKDLICLHLRRGNRA